MKKSILLSLIVIFTSCMSYAQQPKYQLSSHILDISKGLPATDVKISLQKQLQDNQWELVPITLSAFGYGTYRGN